MKTWLYNPFEYIAGYRALFIGLAVMALSTLIGVFSNTHFDGSIDVHIGMHGPVSLFFVETFVSWFVTAVLFYLAGIMLSGSHIRFIDVIGTMAFARIPLILSVFVGFFPVMQQISRLDPSQPGEAIQQLIKILPVLMLVSAPLVASMIWTITLMFNAYKVSCNLKGSRLIASFIITLILSEAATKLILFYGVYKLYNIPIPVPGVK